MPDFSFETAYHTPTAYSDDIYTPFKDIGMGTLSDEEIGDFFEGKRVIDIGSGFEGIARRLFGIFKDSALAPEVINLNPQFTDWHMQDIYKNGTTTSIKRSKMLDIEDGIKELMELSGEDFEGYMTQRITHAGIVQNLDFEDGYFDIQVSTWGFPNVLYDCGGTPAYGVAGYKEILRTQRVGGVALLAPVREGQKAHATLQLQQTGCTYELTFKPATHDGDVMVLSTAQ